MNPLLIDEEILNNFRDNDLECILFFKKLHLILDLDHTLLHAIKPDSLTLHDKQHINPNTTTLHGILGDSYLVKFRPGVETFLNELSTLYNLSIFTMGDQVYAKAVAELLEAHGEGFRFREVLSRENCVTMYRKSLEGVLFHERVVVIVDDTEDVWRDGRRPAYCETNMIKIEPYRFFSTGLVEEEDEGVMDEELARVLRMLRSVHGTFYGPDCRGGDEMMIEEEEYGVEVDYSSRDVREVLKTVREEEMNGRRGRKRSQPMNVFEPAKRFKACTVVNLPCIAC